MTSKQRAYLRGLANSLNPIFQIGKNDYNENFVVQISEALEARELIKISILNNSMQDAKSVSRVLANQTNSHVVQVIGSRFVLYKESKDNKQIQLP